MFHQPRSLSGKRDVPGLRIETWGIRLELRHLHRVGIPADDCAAFHAQVAEQRGSGGAKPKTASSTGCLRVRTELKKFLK